MPSPLGHALAGVAAAWLVGGRLPPGTHATVVFPSRRAGGARLNLTAPQLEWVLFGVVGAAPDLDLLVGAHSSYSHSIGAAVLVGVVVWLVTRRRWPRVAVGIGAAWASHILLDWLGSDTSPPIGIMALWPFSWEYYQSSLCVFDAISRRYWLRHEFFAGNLRAVLKELAILVPTLWLVSMRRRRGLKQRFTPRGARSTD
jgi:inner membrane protein